MIALLSARVLDAWRFPLRRPVLVIAPALIYAALHAVQDLVGTASGAAAQFSGLLVGFAGLIVIVLAVTAWLRDRFEQPQPAGPLPFALGDQEVQVAVSLLLTGLLAVSVAVLGFFGVLLLVGGMMIAARDREGQLAEPAPEELVNILEYFNMFERLVTFGAMGLWLILTLWLTARLTPALPATIASGRVRVLSIWPASSGRAPGVVLASLVTAAPGGALVWALGLTAPVLGAIAAGALQAFAGIALMAAPLIALWSADHRRWLEAQASEAS